MLRADPLSVSALLAAACVQLPGATREEVIEGMVALLDGAEGVVDLDRVRADVFAREELMTTGVGKGLALPHARTAGVTAPVAAFAVTREPVPWEADDGRPVRLVTLLLAPEGEGSLHVRLLGRISRLLIDDAVRTRLLEAATDADVLAVFREAEGKMG